MQAVRHELPATAAVVNRFGMFQDKGCQKQVQALIFRSWPQESRLEREPRSLRPCLQVGPDGSLSCWCNLCQQWDQFVSGELPGAPDWKQYEVLTQELVESLAQHIRQGVRHPCMLESCTGHCLSSCRISSHCAAGSGSVQHAGGQTCSQLSFTPADLLCRQACQQWGSASTVKVLEIGAGDGRLSHYLQIVLREHQQQQQTSTVQQHGSQFASGSCAAIPGPHIDVIATDSGAQDLQQHSPYR